MGIFDAARISVLTTYGMALLLGIYAILLLNATVAMANGSNASGKSIENQLVQALKKIGGFNMAATFLGEVDLNRLLPESSTLLLPMDTGVTESGLQFSTFNTALPILQYHVITRQLSFHDLQRLPVGETLQTLLANSTVLITSNSSANYTVDDVPLSHPDIFLASNMAVHGISGVMSFTMYGKRHLNRPTPPGVNPSPLHSPPPATNRSKGHNESQSSPSPAAAASNSSLSPVSAPMPTSPPTHNASSLSPVPAPIPAPPSHNVSFHPPASSNPHSPPPSTRKPASSPAALHPNNPQQAQPLIANCANNVNFSQCSATSSYLSNISPMKIGLLFVMSLLQGFIIMFLCVPKIFCKTA